MRELITAEAMRAGEGRYFASGAEKSIDVMERAARALAECVLDRFATARRVRVACGPGGNGGDGYACARMLRRAGMDVAVVAPREPKSADAVENARRAAALDIPVNPPESDETDLWIDCLYGTGLSRAPAEADAALIRRMNASGAPVLACDIPSGLNGTSGHAYEPCVRADVTVTFQFAKTGHYLQDGLDMCGEVVARDVGFPESAFAEARPGLIEPCDLRGWFAPKRRNIHKGKNGHLLIVAGSVGMAGAAAMCARAALRGGTGLVTIACPAEIIPILQTLAPCAMCVPLTLEGLKKAFAGKSAIVIGCGLTRGISPEIVRAALESGLPAVIDADALNIISEHPGLKALLRPNHVITPHPGEAARLLGRPLTDPLSDAAALHGLGCCAMLKGASRVICAEDEVYISASGASGMAKGGSGDVYAGILGALIAGESARTIAQSAAAACELHGLCGEAAQKKYGSRAMNALDLIEFLPEVFRAHVE